MCNRMHRCVRVCVHVCVNMCMFLCHCVCEGMCGYAVHQPHLTPQCNKLKVNICI